MDTGLAQATRRGRQLEYFTLGWNILEAVVAVGAGWLAGSVALMGFGIDSVIESLSGATLLWRLQAEVSGAARERQAEWLVGASFFALSAYVAWEAGSNLWLGEPPKVSLVGICLAVAALLVMPVLARAKRRVAAELDSRALVADSKQTDLCAWLSAILLLGLGLNAGFGWWWADPIAGLVMVPIIAREGLTAIRGDPCDCRQNGSRS